MRLYSALPLAILAVASALQADAATLSKEADARLSFARAARMDAVSLAVLAKPGKNAAVVQAVNRVGGRVRYRFDGIDYLIVALPIGQVEALVAESNVESVSVDEPNEDYGKYAGWYSADDTEKATAVEKKSKPVPQKRNDGDDAPWPPPLSRRPLDHPYSILKDMDAQALRDAHPTYDGRGVVIAQVEGFGDFLLPELQVAYDVRGNRIPKFVDLLSFPDLKPSLEAEAPRMGEEWVRLAAPVSGKNAAVNFRDKQYRLPDGGMYRLGELVVPNEYPYIHRGVYAVMSHAYKTHKRGEGKDEKEVVALALAWSDKDQTLRIDANQDQDFSNDEAVPLFSRSGKFGVLGVDNPDTDIRDTMAYAVGQDGNYVNVMFGQGAHVSLVAGAAAANRGDKGRIDGVAPGAQILAVEHGSRVSTFGRAMIAAFSHPRTDVVLIEGRYPVTALHNLNDGRSTLALTVERLVARYRKPAFFTAGNTPGMSTIMDTANGSNVISVGAYQSAASVFAHHGVKTRFPDDLHWVGSEGPAGDGAFKPDLLSPANPVTLYTSFRDDNFGLYRGIFELPPGYIVGGGTSTATPVAAGAAALLVSAAKQAGIAWDAQSIHRALQATARPLQNFPAYKQGRGVLQVQAAWEFMQAQVRQGKPIAIAVDAPVRTVLSHLLPTPDRGRGLFEREGWSVGNSATRTVMLTRTSGPAGTMDFTIDWAGNQKGIFSSAASVSLPLNKPTAFRIDIHAKEVGDHSSNARLRHASLPGVVVDIPVTVVVPYELAASNNYSQTVSLEVERPGRRNLFFRVPQGTAALRLNVSTSRKTMGVGLTAPDGLGEDRRLVRDEAAGSFKATVASPAPGVWQVTIYERTDSREFDWTARDEEFLPLVPVTLNVSAVAAEVRTSLNADGGLAIDARNVMGAFTGSVQGAIGAVRTVEATLGVRQHRTFDLTVEEGTELLVAEVAPAADTAGFDADLYLYDCTTGKCYPVRYGVSLGAAERVLIERPRPGAWKVILSSHRGLDAEQRVVYRDFYTHPRFGSIPVADAQLQHEVGQSWSAVANRWQAATPPTDRTATGVLFVLDPQLRALHDSVPGQGSWASFGDVVPLVLELIGLQTR